MSPPREHTHTECRITLLPLKRRLFTRNDPSYVTPVPGVILISFKRSDLAALSYAGDGGRNAGDGGGGGGGGVSDVVGGDSDVQSYVEVIEEPQPTHRPHSLGALVQKTRFTAAEIKRIYRSFKTECPTGFVRLESFRNIYHHFFPHSASPMYAQHVFRTLDPEQTGMLSFEGFVHALSTLARGSLYEKLRWIFCLYDINGNGRITREEIIEVAMSVHDLLPPDGTTAGHKAAAAAAKEAFQKMDLNKDGVITWEEFYAYCIKDENIVHNISALAPYVF